MRGKTVIEDLERVIQQMRDGDFRECDAAILITRDAENDVLTLVYPGTDHEGGMEIFKEAAESHGFILEEEDDAVA